MSFPSAALTLPASSSLADANGDNAIMMSRKLAAWQRTLLSRRGVLRVPRHKISLRRSKYMVIRVSSRCVRRATRARSTLGPDLRRCTGRVPCGEETLVARRSRARKRLDVLGRARYASSPALCIRAPLPHPPPPPRPLPAAPRSPRDQRAALAVREGREGFDARVA
jgi:hypothetical protein